MAYDTKPIDTEKERETVSAPEWKRWQWKYLIWYSYAFLAEGWEGKFSSEHLNNEEQKDSFQLKTVARLISHKFSLNIRVNPIYLNMSVKRAENVMNERRKYCKSFPTRKSRNSIQEKHTTLSRRISRSGALKVFIHEVPRSVFVRCTFEGYSAVLSVCANRE